MPGLGVLHTRVDDQRAVLAAFLSRVAATMLAIPDSSQGLNYMRQYFSEPSPTEFVELLGGADWRNPRNVIAHVPNNDVLSLLLRYIKYIKTFVSKRHVDSMDAFTRAKMGVLFWATSHTWMEPWTTVKASPVITLAHTAACVEHFNAHIAAAREATGKRETNVILDLIKGGSLPFFVVVRCCHNLARDVPGASPATFFGV
jgi:hypothetical protein